MQQITEQLNRFWQWFKALNRGPQIGIVVAVVVVLVLSVTIASAIRNGGSNTSTSAVTHATATVAKANATPKPNATAAAKPIPTATATTRPSGLATGGMATLGGTIDAFTAKFGTPDTSIASTYSYNRTCGSGTDWCVQASVFNGTDGKEYVDLISISTPDSNQWEDVTTARAACEVYMPPDAKFVQELPFPFDASQQAGITQTGIARIYTSASLAQIFTADQFIDSSGNAVMPGTFDIDYLYTSLQNTSTYSECNIAIGEQ